MKRIDARLRLQLIAANASCHWCGYQGERREFDLDHLLPSSLGGLTSLDNLVAACARCNRSRGNKLAARANEWTSRSVWSRMSTDDRFNDLWDSLKSARETLVLSP